MLKDGYHLPHNSVRIDEFNQMLKSLDLSKEYYYYDELRAHILKSQLSDGTIELFHPAYHKKLSNHESTEIRNIYKEAMENPNSHTIQALYSCQYTPRKTFKQVWNETVRDYTEFFAFLGLLTTYYKGRAGGEKRHYITQRLKDYINETITLEELLLEFRFRNSSKNYDSINMYNITVRPFCIALKALDYYFKKGFSVVNNSILSAIVTYSHDENLEPLLEIFKDPTIKIDNYKTYFDEEKFKSIDDELTRATILLRPYLVHMGYVESSNGFYKKGEKDIDLSKFTNKAVFCNCDVGNVALTPVVGKILFTLYSSSKKGITSISKDNLFDSNVNDNDKNFILQELKQAGCISQYDLHDVYISSFQNQYSINPYTEFFEIEDCDYVQGISELHSYTEELIVRRENIHINTALENLKPIALGSDGALYEKTLYELIRDNFPVFNITWYGANSTGRRLSDIVIKSKIRDEHGIKNILIIVECKAGNAIRAFDERKEKDDIERTLQKERTSGTQIDGVWYWVVDSNSLPTVDEHGGYRTNEDSRSFVEKLSSIQFDISEYMRVPTIVTAFSYEAVKSYITYLSDKIGNLRDTAISKVDAPHFWRWSRKFMNLQYVMVHKELRLGE